MPRVKSYLGLTKTSSERESATVAVLAPFNEIPKQKPLPKIATWVLVEHCQDS